MSHADEQQSAILKALADETRLRLTRLLWREELNVQELCEILDLAQPRVSRHLATLRAAGIVRDQREGTRVYYRVAGLEDELQHIRDYLQRIAAQPHPDIERMDAVLRQRSRLSLDFADQAAPEWDQIGLQLHSSTAALFALAHLAPRGLTLADLGCGTGLLLPVLAAFADCVYAIDQSAEMLEHARRRCQEGGIDNVHFIETELEDLPQALPEPCDCMLLHFVLHQVARPGLMLNQLREALSPGGRLVIVDRTAHEDESSRTKFGSLWLGFERDRIEQWLDEAGFAGVLWQRLSPPETGVAAGPVFVVAAVSG